MDTADEIVIVSSFVTFYVIIPIIMLYRRGYFINFGRWLEWWKNFLNRNSLYLPEKWIIVSVRPLTRFEKFQIKYIKVQLKIVLGEKTRYCAIITLNSGKTVEYPLGEEEGYYYWIDKVIHKDNILLRTWQKGNKYYYDLVPIKEES